MKKAIAFLRIAVHLIVEESFAISVFFVVVVATVLAFGFGAASEIVSGVLIVGLVTLSLKASYEQGSRDQLTPSSPIILPGALLRARPTCE